MITGKVGKDLTPEEGQKAAERVGLSILATLDNEIGDLDKVKRIVKLVGFVNCVDGFEQQPFVINGCSDLMARYVFFFLFLSMSVDAKHHASFFFFLFHYVVFSEILVFTQGLLWVQTRFL